MRLFFSILLLILSNTAYAYTEIENSIKSDCFSGNFESYETFKEFLVSKNNGSTAIIERLQKAIPQATFEKAKNNLDCNNLSYTSDGFKVMGYLVKPQNIGNNKLPVIVYNRGGNHAHAIRFFQLFRAIIPYANQGFIVVASQYRGVIPQRAELFGEDEFGGKDVNDVHKLIDMVKKHPNVDVNNIFMFGASRGGMMNYLVAKDRTDIRAIVSLAGPTDVLKDLKWRPEMEIVYEKLIPDYENNKEVELKKRSVMYWADKLPKQTPILLLHGDQDKRVHVDNSINLSKRLNELNHPNKLVIYPGDDHGIRKHKEDWQAEMFAWFKQHMNHDNQTKYSKLETE